MKVDSSERSFTDGSEKELCYILPEEGNAVQKNVSEEIREPYVLLSRDFSSSDIALVYNYKARYHNKH